MNTLIDLTSIFFSTTYYVATSGTGSGTLQNRYCGGFLSATAGAIGNDVVRDCTGPFEASFVTDDATDGTATTLANGNAGLCLTFAQEPCNT